MVLVDSSAWIAFFKGSIEKQAILGLIDTNTICTNDLILTELIPSLKVRKENDLIFRAKDIRRVVVHAILGSDES